MQVFAVYEQEDDYSYARILKLFLHRSDAEKYLQFAEKGYHDMEVTFIPDLWVSAVEVHESFTATHLPIQEYTIYFPNKEDGNYSKVGTVMASHLEDAWIKAQNFDAPWNPAEPCRSAMIGDHIETPDNKFYEIAGKGFKRPFFRQIVSTLLAEEDPEFDEEAKWDKWRELHDQPDQE